ncbi:DUF2637 domain-containing protein [Streptomyces purpurascens]|uniref:DUF2637 domain-containing protein n=1 Tax=Streptomyces purpurascens TaxID=1924 RepID=UPI00198B85F4|nr:DUF2637 domain-containing protein [Streptomyces purpurascens]MCE7048103.1 DUF2637 domain-containing protein [Streptomyces purpurascens]GHA29558.1 hypothetical protein GCM10010303_45230 [Streptomyces purpurascens]
MSEPLTSAQLESVEKTLARGTWAVTAGAVLFSVLTVTPLVERVTPDQWEWTAPILPLVVDAAVVIVIRLDATVARLGGDSGPWPGVLRWMTGLMTLLLNIGDSALKGDLVGVAVHSVAPLLLIVTAEAGLAYRRAIGRAQERIERSRAAEKAQREQREREQREHERQERERAEQSAREHAERLEQERAEREAAERAAEREHAARMERERLDREAEMRREQREYEERVRREDQQRADALRREQQAQAERSRRERQALEPAPAAVDTVAEQAVMNTPAVAVNSSVNGTDVFTKMPEAEARAYIRSFQEGQRSVRQLAEDTGWSVGWVSARLQEVRDAAPEFESVEAVV